MIIKHIAKVHKINEISNIRCAKLSIPFLLPIVLLHLSPDSGIEDASLLIFLSIDLLFPQSTATPTPLFGKMITIFLYIIPHVSQVLSCTPNTRQENFFALKSAS